MEVIKKILTEHSAEFLARKIGVTKAILYQWARHPERISFKNLDKLHKLSLITTRELRELEGGRDKYLTELRTNRK